MTPEDSNTRPEASHPDSSETVEAPSDEVCLCFHVPLNKIVKFIRIERPQVASQCSECFGAGTGCGWCIPFLERLHEDITNGIDNPSLSMDKDEYRARRGEHLKRIRENKPRETVTGPVQGMQTDLLDDEWHPESTRSLNPES